MVCFVYVIESIEHKTRYTGLSYDPEKRLTEHNQGKAKFTKSYTPWKLIYTEKCESRIGARKREKYLKSAAGRKYINKYLISNEN